MTKSEIQQELEENIIQIEKLIGKQTFRVEDAHRFLARYFNFVRKIEQLSESRDKWKKKYTALKAKVDFGK